MQHVLGETSQIIGDVLGHKLAGESEDDHAGQQTDGEVFGEDIHLRNGAAEHRKNEGDDEGHGEDGGGHLDAEPKDVAGPPQHIEQQGFTEMTAADGQELIMMTLDIEDFKKAQDKNQAG